MKSFVLISIIALLSNVASSQNSGCTVLGDVKADSTRQSLEFTNVVLLKKTDGTIVTGTVTDSKGAFHIDNVPSGEFILRYTLLGYEEKRTAPFKITAQQHQHNAGTALLRETTVRLGGVTVTSEKPVFTEAIDRKVYNVQQAVVSTTGSVSELLQNIPSVQVDVDGTVSLRGSANVEIMIDGKPSPLLASGASDVLQQIPANSVQTIEVITNPSARFKPDGTSGIINIVMKKDANTGLNGTVGSSVGNDSRYNFNASGNYNPGGMNFFGTYSFRRDERNSWTSDVRQQRDSASAPASMYTQNGHNFNRPYAHFATVGFDAHIDENSKAGLSGNFRRRGFSSDDVASYVLTNSASQLSSDYDRRRNDIDQTTFFGGTAFLERKISGDDQSVRSELNVTHMFDQEDNRFTDVFRYPPTSNEYDRTLIQEYDNKGEFTLDYHLKLMDGSVFEAGYDGETAKNDFPFSASYFDATLNSFVSDTQKTNHFIYRETIHAFYGTYKSKLWALSFLGGLRAEIAQISSDLPEKGTVVPSNYFRLYPTLHLSYKIAEFSELQLNYSLRANRPRGDDLNPFPEYRDPTSVRAGNPLLKPEFIHSVELGWQLQSDMVTVTPSIFYRNRYNGFTSVTTALSDSVLLTTQQNLSKDQSGGFELVLGGSVGKIMTANLSANAFYEQIDASNLGYASKKSTISWNGNMNCNVNLTKSTMIQVNGNYRSARLTPQGESRPSYVVNLGLRQELLDSKLTLIFTIADAFQTLNGQRDLNSPLLNEHSFNSRDTRVTFFGVTYHFGVAPKSSKEKAFQYDDNN
ncbi:MAG TPA: TonB-dependent receptor [Bacteroidota bacterium]|nr:TonB-dependent receptor [Bacteroidota bacterium]